VVDDRLVDDADGPITSRLAGRMQRLIDHAVLEGADAVLLTCSMYAVVAHRAAVEATVPVHGPDDGLFGAIACSGFRRIALVAPGVDPLADSLARIREAIGSEVAVDGVVAEGAASAARAGDLEALVETIVSTMGAISPTPDAIVLGQYSLAAAAGRVQAAIGVPTLAAPEYAVRRLRAVLTGDAS